MPRITQRCRERRRAEQRSHFSSVPISAQDRLFLSLSQAPQPGEAKSLEAEAVMHFARQMILAHVALGRALRSPCLHPNVSFSLSQPTWQILSLLGNKENTELCVSLCQRKDARGVGHTVVSCIDLKGLQEGKQTL